MPRRRLALVCAAAAACCAAPLEVAEGGARGYAASFQGELSIAGIRRGAIDLSATGWADVDSRYSVALWVKHDVTNVPAIKFRISSPQHDNLLDFNEIGFLLDWVWNTPVMVYAAVPRFWTHYVFSVDGVSAVAYVNGSEYARTSGPAVSLRRSDATLYFGGILYTEAVPSTNIRNNLAYNFNGQLDEFMFWSRALGAGEAAALFAAPRDRALPVPVDLVLWYTFDVEGCEPASPSGLLARSCAATGVDAVFRNLGVSGDDYDLLVGQLSDELGFGRSYSDQTGTLPLRRFVKPVPVASTVPWGGSGSPSPAVDVALADGAPLVLKAPRGARLLAVPLVPSAGCVLSEVPAVALAVLRRGSDNATLARGASLAGESLVLLEFVGESLLTPVWFALANATRLQQEVHVWPPQAAPTLLSTSAQFRVLQGKSTHLLRLDTFARTSTGEKPDMVITALPTRGGLLRVLGVSIVGEAGVTGEALAVGEQVAWSSEIGLTVALELQIEFTGLSELSVVFVSPSTGLASPALRVATQVQPVDLHPTAQEQAAVSLAEDSPEGLDIWLGGADKSERFGLFFLIESLPQLGDLYVEDVDGTRRLIELPHNQLDIGSGVSSQYPWSANVSSFQWHGCQLSEGPFALVGGRQCMVGDTTLQQNPGCLDLRSGWGTDAWANSTWLPDPGSVVAVWDRRAGARISVAARVTELYADKSGRPRMAVRVLPQQRLLGDGITWVPCIEVLVNPADENTGNCSVEALRSEPDKGGAYELRDLATHDLAEFQGVPFVGYWSPMNRGFIPGLQRAEPDAGCLGTQYYWTLNHSETYNAQTVPPYTEWMQLGFQRAVYPVGVRVGHPRGGGAVVNVKAWNALAGEWVSLYQGDPQRQKYAETNGRGLYFTFDEPSCRQAFKTDTIRVELDTSFETGIADWVFVDFVELIGADDMQPATLRTHNRTGRNRVTYVPRKDQSGHDSFRFSTSDCLGDGLRQSANAGRVSVEIEPRQDAPLVSIAASASTPASFRCGMDRAAAVEVVVDELDGEAVSLRALLPPAPAAPLLAVELGAPVADERPATSGPGAGVRATRRWRTLALVAADCAQLSASVTELSFAVVATDTSGLESAPARVALRALKEDRGAMSWGARGVCYAMFLLDISLALVAMAWSVVNRGKTIVRVSQIHFLLLMALGSIVSLLTIPLSVVESDRLLVQLETSWPDLACNLMVWTYCIGYVLTFGSLYVKLHRVELLFDANFVVNMAFGSFKARAKRQREISNARLWLRVAGMCAINVIACGLFTGLAPLAYTRAPKFVDPVTGYTLASSAMCYSKSFATFAALVMVGQLAGLAHIAVVCYRSRFIDSRFSESKYLSLAIYSNLQILLVALPIMYLVSDNADATAFIRSAAIFLINLSTLLLVFLPKMLLTHSAEIAPIAPMPTQNNHGSPTTTEQIQAPTSGELDMNNWVAEGILAEARKHDVGAQSVKAKPVNSNESAGKPGSPKSKASSEPSPSQSGENRQTDR
jgi:hypothetical protein